jgi:hypothetical protein
MKTTQVWFGVFEFGDFEKCGDKFPCALIRRIDAKLIMDPDQADDYMTEHHYDAYLIPKQFDGEIYYSEVAK